jgi:Kef-type K+ transport system membrane component KefB
MMTPAIAMMTAAGSRSGELVALLGTLVAIIVATKLLGDLAQRIGQPAVLGELIAGIILGASVLGLIKPDDPVVHALAEIGVLVLLFEIGLHTDLKAVAAVGRTAVTVAIVGVVVPFALGYSAAVLLGVSRSAAIVCAAALTATSIGISARVLSDLGRLHKPEGQVVLGAAVLDDIVGLVILTVVTGMIGGVAPSPGRVIVMAASALSFVLLAVIVGTRTVPYFFTVIVERARVSGALPLIALAFAFGLAWLADFAGSAPIIGAFAAGLVLHPTTQRPEIEAGTTSIGHFFVPIFFASVGASVDLGALMAPRPLLIGAALTIVAIIGKLVAGFAPWWFPGNSLLVGVAMVPRGEVGLIFAQMGLATGALKHDLFGALMLMVLVTTLVTPPALAWVAREFPLLEIEGIPEKSEEGGIDDLVAGSRGRGHEPDG